MSKKSQRPPAAGELIAAKPEMRPLKDTEIVDLETALGKPIDRHYLVYWVSRAIDDVLRFSSQPTPRAARDELSKIAREGRAWIQRINEFSGAFLLRQYAELDGLTTTVAEFCAGVDSVIERLEPSVTAGHPRIPIPLEAFLHNMIGIAKKAKVLPSTPSRASTGREAGTAFLNFVQAALAISRDVIESSPLADEQKQAGLSILQVQSRSALIKILETLRGRIGDYRDSAGGLVEWNGR
jgi:hypothetical protein